MKNKIRTIVVDDESHCREVLRDLLESFFPEVQLLGEAENVESAYKLIADVEPQLVFLDIQMSRQSGFNLLKKFDEVPFEVIFVTSFDRYAINAIKFSALDYLLKPVEVKDLGDAINKATKSIELKSRSSLQIINLIGSMESDKVRQVAVHEGDHVKLLKPSDILFIEADGRYSEITTVNNEKHITAKLLKEFEEYFGSNSEFIRIHKGCMINSSHIKEYSKGEPCTITMSNSKTFEVARRKKVEILEVVKRR